MPDIVTANKDWKSIANHNLFIVWQPSYNLGIPIIDEQHRGIVSTINSLCFAIQHRHGNDILRPTIGVVKEYTRIHFENEEDFLQKCGYPDIKEHQELHKELTDTLSRIGPKSIMDKDPQEFLAFLTNWWIDHICQKDQVFCNYVEKKR
ncbi:MAG: hemerythrin family protein [Treponema sp.]|jgi:hemerythrin|nr:hemerythrin family protein [Treponema sp.]